MNDERELAQLRLLGRLGLEVAPSRFDEALTHPSYANEVRGTIDNQRLEFLGDGVLDLCVSEQLLDAMPDADAGALSRAYAALVSTEALARWAEANDVAAALRLGRGAQALGESRRAKVLADAVEAIVAAVWLESGLEGARAVARRILGDALTATDALAERDPKTALQEKLQAGGAPGPLYTLVAAEGPDHDRTFVVDVVVDGAVLARGRGRTKKQAESAAAALALALKPDDAGKAEEA